MRSANFSRASNFFQDIMRRYFVGTTVLTKIGFRLKRCGADKSSGMSMNSSLDLKIKNFELAKWSRLLALCAAQPVSCAVAKIPVLSRLMKSKLVPATVHSRS